MTWRTLLLAGLVATLSACGAAPGPDVVTLTDALFVAHVGPPPPPAADAGWHPQQRPDFWDVARRRRTTEGWYHLAVPLDHAPEELWAFYLPRVCLNAVVYVNGVLIGDGGRFTEPTARN